jgi:hypothetical protein
MPNDLWTSQHCSVLFSSTKKSEFRRFRLGPSNRQDGDVETIEAKAVKLSQGIVPLIALSSIKLPLLSEDARLVTIAVA